jgi:3-hydroxyacyl-[acyl-carrier-protein] dehydratase
VSALEVQHVELRFAEDHPTAAGHFPGNPIIPGALLLDAVLLAVAGEAVAPFSVIRSAKFLRPVRPGDRIKIRWEQKGDETYFSCILSATDDIAVTGTLRMGNIPG